MLNKGAFALEIVRGDPELTADCRVRLNRGDRIGSFDCTYKPMAINTDRKDSGSLVLRELSYPSHHAVFSMTQSELPCPIKYDRKSVVDNNKISALFNYICALAMARSQTCLENE